MPSFPVEATQVKPKQPSTAILPFVPPPPERHQDRRQVPPTGPFGHGTIGGIVLPPSSPVAVPLQADTQPE